MSIPQERQLCSHKKSLESRTELKGRFRAQEKSQRLPHVHRRATLSKSNDDCYDRSRSYDSSKALLSGGHEVLKDLVANSGAVKKNMNLFTARDFIHGLALPPQTLLGALAKELGSQMGGVTSRPILMVAGAWSKALHSEIYVSTIWIGRKARNFGKTSRTLLGTRLPSTWR